jgi:hypothetical protein
MDTTGKLIGKLLGNAARKSSLDRDKDLLIEAANEIGRLRREITLNDDDCYELFLCLDTCARLQQGRDERVNAMRERFLPFYRDWHAANPHKVHPGASR